MPLMPTSLYVYSVRLKQAVRTSWRFSFSGSWQAVIGASSPPCHWVWTSSQGITPSLELPHRHSGRLWSDRHPLCVRLATIMKRKLKQHYLGKRFLRVPSSLTEATCISLTRWPCPVSASSRTQYSGATDAMHPVWYGHNAVGVLLTLPAPGHDVLLVPRAGQPHHSYRLSIVHFWALISIYIMGRPHHLHYTAHCLTGPSPSALVDVTDSGWRPRLGALNQPRHDDPLRRHGTKPAHRSDSDASWSWHCFLRHAPP